MDPQAHASGGHGECGGRFGVGDTAEVEEGGRHDVPTVHASGATVGLELNEKTDASRIVLEETGQPQRGSHHLRREHLAVVMASQMDLLVLERCSQLAA